MEAFDPFADDDEIHEEGAKQRTPPRSSSSPIIVPSPRDNKPRNSPKQGRRNSKTNNNTQADIDIMREFGSFQSMNINETTTNTTIGTFDQFGFPTNNFPATFDDGVSVLTSDNNNIDNVFSNINIRQTTYIPNIIKQNTMVVTMGVDYFCIVSSKG